MVKQGRDALSQLPLAESVEVVIPTEWVTFTSAVLPLGNRRRLFEALPYLIEDHLISSPEQVHVVIAQTEHKTQATLATIDKALLTTLLSHFEQHGVTVSRAFPACMLTKGELLEWHLVCDDAHFFLSTTSGKGIALTYEDEQTIPIELTLALQQATKTNTLPKRMLVYGKHSLALNVWQSQLGVPMQAMTADWKALPLQTEFNFLQGVFAPQNKKWQALIQAKPAFKLLFAVGVLALLGSAADWAFKTYQKNQLDQKMKLLFLGAFPEANNVVNAPLQLQRKLQELQHASGEIEGGDFLPLLAKVTQFSGGLDLVRSIRYQDQTLTLLLQADNAASAQALVQKLSTQGYMTTIDDLKPVEGGVSFTLSFKEIIQ